MNCNKTRKFLLAFADGQLSVQANCEVLDHLKMCPACSEIVDEHQALRRIIAKSAEKVVVPAGLDAKVRHAIESAGVGRSRKPGAPVRSFRLARTLAAAACIVIVAAVSWQFFPSNSIPNSTPFLQAVEREFTVADRVTQGVIIRHNQCVVKTSEHQSHQNKQLPGDRVMAARKIDEHFADSLATAAPDLSGYGYQFESANFCNPTGPSDAPAAHLMYVNYNYGNYLSVFTVPHWSEIDVEGTTPDRDSPFIHSTRDCENISMLAWHEGEMTHIFVGKFDAEAMTEMIRDLKLTEGRAFNSEILAAVCSQAPWF